MDCNDSNSDGEGKGMDEEVSGLEAMLRRRKQLKTNASVPAPAPASTKMNWTKQDELLILAGILDYERETKLSYRSDWEAFYRYIKDVIIDSNFSKKQLVDKVKNLKKRFSSIVASGKEPSFPNNTHDDQLFKLSINIWSTTNQTEPAPNHHIIDQQQQPKEDLPCVKPTSREKIDDNGEKEDKEKIDDNGEKEDKEKIDDNGEKEDKEGEEEEFCLLQEALEDTSFGTLGKYQLKLLIQNLRNLGAKKTKELTDEWKALLLEELQFNIKKQAFSLKLASA